VRKYEQERKQASREFVASSQLKSLLKDGERVIRLPQFSTSVTNICETVHVP